MQTSIDMLLRRGLIALTLRGYGWKRRKRGKHDSCRVEWQEPVTGHWYGEPTALRLLKRSLLAEYPEPERENARRGAHFRA